MYSDIQNENISIMENKLNKYHRFSL